MLVLDSPVIEDSVKNGHHHYVEDKSTLRPVMRGMKADRVIKCLFCGLSKSDEWHHSFTCSKILTNRIASFRGRLEDRSTL